MHSQLNAERVRTLAEARTRLTGLPRPVAEHPHSPGSRARAARVLVRAANRLDRGAASRALAC